MPLKRKKELKEKNVYIIKPLIVLLLSVISVFYAISFQYVKNLVMSLFFLMNTSINAPMTALFFLSMFNPYANHVGALSTFIIAVGMNLFLGIGSVLTAINNPKSQEFFQSTNGCSNLTPLRYLSTNTTYIPDNQSLFTLFSVSTVWYSLCDFIFIIVFGSLISLVYSLIAKRRVDLDEEHAEERKKYLFYFKKNFVFSNCCKSSKKFDIEILEEKF